MLLRFCFCCVRVFVIFLFWIWFILCLFFSVFASAVLQFSFFCFFLFLWGGAVWLSLSSCFSFKFLFFICFCFVSFLVFFNCFCKTRLQTTFFSFSSRHYLALSFPNAMWRRRLIQKRSCIQFLCFFCFTRLVPAAMKGMIGMGMTIIHLQLVMRVTKTLRVQVSLDASHN